MKKVLLATLALLITGVSLVFGSLWLAAGASLSTNTHTPMPWDAIALPLALVGITIASWWLVFRE